MARYEVDEVGVKTTKEFLIYDTIRLHYIGERFMTKDIASNRCRILNNKLEKDIVDWEWTIHRRKNPPTLPEETDIQSCKSSIVNKIHTLTQNINYQIHFQEDYQTHYFFILGETRIKITVLH